MSSTCNRAPAGGPHRRRIAAPLLQLTLVRVREFIREPEAVFWAIFFPDPAHDRTRRRVSQPAAGRRCRSPRRPRRSPTRCASEPGLAVDLLPPEAAARRRCASARSRCSPSRRRGGGVLYRYDDTNPEGRDGARARRPRGPAGRRAQSIRCHATRRPGARAGLAVRRLPGARPRRARHHEQRRLGPRLLDRRRAPPQADQAPDGDADVARALPAARS